MSISLVYPLQALLIGLLAIEVLRHSAKRINLVDRPNHRKLHGGEVPVVGGLGIFCAFLMSAMVVPGLYEAYAFLFAPALILTLLGLVDDVYDLRPVIKLLMQFLIAGLVLVSNSELALKGGDGSDAAILNVVLWAVTVLTLVGAMNAFNMMDGVDGLAGAVTAVALFWIAAAAAISGLHIVLLMSVQLLMAVFAFLFFNARAPWRRQALVFLGDAGSLLLGFGVTVLGLQLVGRGSIAWSPLAIVFVIALPAMDTASLAVRRIVAGRSPLSADRQHLHHLLQDAGLTAGQVTAVITAASVIIGGLGIALGLAGANHYATIALLLVLFAGHCVVVGALRRRIERRRLALAVRSPAAADNRTRKHAPVAPVGERIATVQIPQTEVRASN
jgi:UDP-GlcNAc:undecaprenyl-phosphate/decaprenyl-phosphate GlcNAc-1-phosphate transferase